MNLELKIAWQTEIDAARTALSNGALDLAVHHFERAHILGQRHTRAHVQAHIGMLEVGWRRRDTREMAGQLTRIIAASLFSKIWVPEGNTGGANVSAVKPMSIPEDLRRILYP